ncbi:MAG: hypothetical protein SFY80_02005 [Verrucomicrobiota bacterium]|nr:hypothetical protein [Verrucomicrobiota bacterium]
MKDYNLLKSGRLSHPFTLAVLITTLTATTSFAAITKGGNGNWFYNNQTNQYPFVTGATFQPGTNPWKSVITSGNGFNNYGTIRMMDFNSTCNSGQVTWSTRRSPTSTNQEATYINQGQNLVGRGIAIEWQIDLAKRVNKYIWVNIPHKADDNYITQMATLLRDNVPTDKLIYVEYSNEIWNGGLNSDGVTYWGYDPGRYCAQKGVAENIGGTGKLPDERRLLWGGKRTAKVFQIFNTVFSGQTSRLRKVLGSQTGNTWISGRVWEGYSTYGGGGGAHALAIAPYFGYNVNGADSDWEAQCRADITNSIAPKCNAQKTFCTGKSISLYAYEAGQHMITNATGPNRSNAMESLYTDYANELGTYFSGPFCSYSHCSYYNANNCWGLQEVNGTATAKWRGFLTW